MSSYWLRGEGLVWQWLTGAVVCLLAAPRVELFAGAPVRAMDGRVYCAAALAHANQLPLPN